MTWRNPSQTLLILDKIRSTVNKILVVYDTETVGLKSDAKIIQFSAHKYVSTTTGLRPVDELDIYINPEEEIPEKIEKLTGITNPAIAGCPTEKEVVDTILGLFKGADFVVGYNLTFDNAKVNAMALRCGRYWSDSDYITVDVLKIAKDIIPADDIENYKLQTVVDAVLPDADFEYHSAANDAVATAMLLEKFLEFSVPEKHGSRELKVERAYYYVNPNKKSQVRIKLILNVGENGAIFWDCVRQVWDCKKDKKSQSLFAESDMVSIERQVLKKYAWLYDNAKDMATLGKNWAAADRKRKKEKSSAV